MKIREPRTNACLTRDTLRKLQLFSIHCEVRFSKLMPKLRIGAQLSTAVSSNLHTHNLGDQGLQFAEK